jgi:Phasin protein
MKGAIMDEVRKPEGTNAVPDFGSALAHVSSDATRRFCEQGQTIARTITEWNTEVSHFLGHRAARNGEAIGRITKCQGLPEVFAIQAQWVRDAADDYLKEMSKLMDANSKIMGDLMGSVEQTKPRSSPAKASMRAAS